MSSTDGRQAVADALRLSGVGLVLGVPWPGFGVREVPVDLLDVMALATERVGPTMVARHRGNGVVDLGHGPRTDVVTARSADDAARAIVDAATTSEPGTHRVVLDFDLDAPARPAVIQAPDETWADADGDAASTISAAQNLLGLVGPGVLQRGHVAGLRTFAAAANLGVVNTWGAKGVFHWQSRHHLASIGLQADDFTLSGIDDTDLLVTSGIDELEAPPSQWAHVPHIGIAPARLAATSELLARGNDPIPMPPIRERLVRVTAAGWESSAVPVAPSLLTRIYGEIVGGDGLVAADPGRAGFFVARTSGTTRPGGVLVPADGDADGFAVAAVIAAALATPWRRSIAVVDDPHEPVTAAMLDLAARWSIAVTLDAWDDDGRCFDASEHRDRLRASIGRHTSVERVLIDGDQLDAYVVAAGELTCWPSRRADS